MLKHHLTSAFRNLRKSFFYSFISIAGLVLGLGACIVLVNYTIREKSFDDFHRDKKNIYRVESYFKNNNQVTDSWVSSSFGYAGAMKAEFPEIKEIVRVNNYDCERTVKYKQNIYREPRVVLADSNFFSFFSYSLIKGDPAQVLRDPNSIVISEAAARKYFQDEDPIGKVMRVSTLKSKYDCAVTGVFKDFPRNSSLELDLVVSYSSATKWEQESWYMHEAYTYVKVNSEQDIKTIETKFPALAEKYKTEPALKEHEWCINLIPLTAIHLNPSKTYELEEKGNRNAVNMLFIIAFVILAISWVNYINLFISRAMERAGEIGVRKMAGATPLHILKQFIIESFLVNSIALILFFALMLLLTRFAEALSWQDILYGFWQNAFTWKIILLAFITGTLLTGVVPALVLRKLKTAVVLKNKLAFRAGAGNGLRKGLIVFQYFSAVVLIISTLTIRKQLLFMQSQDLGISSRQTFVFKTPPKLDSNYERKMEMLTEQLKRINGTRYVTQSSAVPGKMVGYVMANRKAGEDDKINKMCEMFRVDYDFLPAYNLQIIKGRNFSKEYGTDRDNAIILTENAMGLFGFKDAEDAISGSIYLEGHKEKRFPVIGVVKDYHQLSLKESFRPIVFMMYNPWEWINNHYVSVKAEQVTGTSFVAGIKAAFNNSFPESSFDYFFLDDYFNRQYNKDIRYGEFILAFSALALAIVIFGIISMSGMMLLKRRKEISIRKVNGAGTFHILSILNAHFVKLIAIAFITGTPVAMIIMHNWLQSFASRTSVDILILAAAIFIIVLATVITVSVLSYRTAAQNPIKALRTE